MTTERLRILVMGGDPGHHDYSDPNAPDSITNTTHAWARALKCRWEGRKEPFPRPQDLAQYDLIIADLNRQRIAGYVPLVENRPAHVRWVSLIEGCGLDYVDPSPNLLRVLDASDLLATINRRTTRYLQSLTKTPAAWIGVPHPGREIAAFQTPPEQRRDEALVCPRVQRKPSFVVAEALGVTVCAYFEKVSRTTYNIPVYFKHRYFKRDLRAHFWMKEPFAAPRRPLMWSDLPAFWKEAGGCKLWVNLDPRYTWARFVLDAAALQVPIITTESTDHAPLLFPETTVRDVFCVEEAIAIGRRLLAEPDFARHVGASAAERLEEFSPDACVRRLSAALNTDLTGKVAQSPAFCE